MGSSPAERLADAYDALFTEERTHRLERLIIRLAIIGFLVHLGLIFFARQSGGTIPILTPLSQNYLAALYTPFSFILFYEVLLLILSIPRSTTRSIGRQYEIISLIVIRNVFKDIAAFDSFQVIQEQFDDFINVLIDMGGGLLMFLIVAVFYHIRQRHRQHLPTVTDISPRLRTFIQQKKAVALTLAGLLFILAAYNLVLWSYDVVQVAYFGAEPTIDVGTIFYIDLFTVMIFSDVLVLLFSMLHADIYQLVFRNAGFIVSTILIRFSLTLSKPYDVELALLAMVFGTLVLLVYHYFTRIAPPRHAAAETEAAAVDAIETNADDTA